MVQYIALFAFPGVGCPREVGINLHMLVTYIYCMIMYILKVILYFQNIIQVLHMSHAHMSSIEDWMDGCTNKYQPLLATYCSGKILQPHEFLWIFQKSYFTTIFHE